MAPQYPAAQYPPPQYLAAQYPVTRMNPAMRAATSDRERTVDVLRAGFTEGRLTQPEYNDRMSRAYEARTYGELQGLVADLPAGPLPVMYQPAWQPAPVAGTNSMAIASLVLACGMLFTGGLTSLPAIICGHIARGQIKRSGEDGSGMAVAGLVLGYAFIGFMMVMVVLLGLAIGHSGIPSQG